MIQAHLLKSTSRSVAMSMLALALVGLWGCPSSNTVKPDEKAKVKEKPLNVQEAEAMGIEVKTWEQYTAATAELSKEQPDRLAALKNLEAVLEAKPDFAEAHYNVALIQERLGKIDAAKTHLEKARQLNPDAQTYKVAMGRLYAESGEFDKANALFNEALARDPDSVGARNNLAILALKKQDYEKAKEYVIDILRDDDQNIEALNTLGLIYAGQKNYSTAKYVFTKALCAAGEELKDCLAKDDAPAEVAAATGDKKAEPKAAEPKPEPKKEKPREKADPLVRADIYNNLAFVFFAEEKLPQAVVAWDKANAASPAYLASRLNLGSVLIEFLDYQRADKLFAEAVGIAPENCVANLGLGATQYALAKYEQAATRYSYYVDNCDKEHVSSYERLAKLNESFLKQPAKAIDYYRKLLSLNTDPKKQQQYKAMIGFLESQTKQQAPKTPSEEPKAEEPKTDAQDGQAPKAEEPAAEEAAPTE